MFIKLIDRDGATHWVNPERIEQVTDSMYYKDECDLYFTSGRCIRFESKADDTVEMIKELIGDENRPDY